MMALNAVGCAMMSVNSISSMSPGIAPLTNTGPVSGCTAPVSSLAKSATVVVRPDLAVQPVARLQCDLLALGDFGHRRDVRMVAVMTAVRLIAQSLAAIDTDCVHGELSLSRCETYSRAATTSDNRGRRSPAGSYARTSSR